jgi:AAA+ superfamily predicted ATPase
MLFYKMEGLLVNDSTEQEDSRRAQREQTRRIAMKIQEFNYKCNRDVYCFVAAFSDGLLTAGMITDQTENAQALMHNFLKSIGCALQNTTLSEITISGIQQLLGRADHGSYIEDASEIMERFGIDRVTGRRGRGIEFGENIIDGCNRKDILKTVERYLMSETMLPEMERIYAGTSAKMVQGHPVHYILQTDNADTRREAGKLLLQALYANGRLRSKRYCFLNFYPGQDFSQMAFESLYQVCAGGTVIVRYLPNDDSEDDEVSGNERDTIARICEVVKHHRNKVLTIFCLPRECQSAKALFYESLGTMTMVEVREEFSDHARACNYLKGLAKDCQIRTDRALFAKLDPETGYLATELHSLFDEWYNDKLKTTVYPQYKNLQVVQKEVLKAAPKGSAYDELQEMIGLTEAKTVIWKALNYYKMQKLYEEKGVKPDSPAMHMVFTGNPGTAKTTAARLFARIMKDNGLLSKGQLVEVGRGDLVGKYVGWTAQTVQAKFKAAKGGVLFIDEAYSLVDDRSGSYGDEAINTIVQEMENHREDVVVIFAGYPNEMEKFLQKNPGLRSRIAFHVPFADYNAEELCQIAQMMGKSKGVCFEKEALTKLTTAFEVACKQSDFGNGRYVRNILEQAKMNQASRLLEYDFDDITTEEIKTIKAVDIIIPEVKTEVKRTIGFAC